MPSQTIKLGPPARDWSSMNRSLGDLLPPTPRGLRVTAVMIEIEYDASGRETGGQATVRYEEIR